MSDDGSVGGAGSSGAEQGDERLQRAADVDVGGEAEAAGDDGGPEQSPAVAADVAADATADADAGKGADADVDVGADASASAEDAGEDKEAPTLPPAMPPRPAVVVSPSEAPGGAEVVDGQGNAAADPTATVDDGVAPGTVVAAGDAVAADESTGEDSIQSFLGYEDKNNVLLARLRDSEECVDAVAFAQAERGLVLLPQSVSLEDVELSARFVDTHVAHIDENSPATFVTRSGARGIFSGPASEVLNLSSTELSR